MIRRALFVFLTLSTIHADTINSISKNPSIAVLGTQRNSSDITSAITETSCSGWGGDLNTLEGTAGTTACYNGVGLGNAPTGDWYFIYVTRHVNSANYYAVQRAVGMTGGVAGIEYIRSQQSGSANVGWSAWAQVGGGGVTGSNSANGYATLANGLIIQWGSFSQTGISTAFNFPIAFPNACFIVTTTVQGNASMSESGVINVSRFGATSYRDAAVGNLWISYITTGY